MCADLAECAQIYLNMCRFSSVCADSAKCVQIYLLVCRF